MASPTFGAAGTYLSGASSNQYNFAVPTGTANNEIVLVYLYLESTGTVTTIPTGFTQKSRPTVAGGEAHDLLLFWKRCTGTDSGTYNFVGPNVWREGVAIRYSGCVTSGDPFDTPISTNSTTSATSGNAPAVSLTTTVTDTMLIYSATNFQGGTWTPASGMTERADAGGDLTVDDLAQTSIAASGTKQAVCAGGAHASLAFLLALKSTTSTASVGSDPGAWRRRRMSGLLLR
jgi:hypothetical protein